MPTRYVHEPWVAPVDVQQTAGCVVGIHYPMPIVDHIKASQINIERIKQVYAQLAKFKPQGTLNPQIVQRPNVIQSSPSPTSIIRNINQSSYLCSQTPPDKETAPEYSNKGEQAEQDKEIPYKEVIIVTQNDHSDNTKQASFDKQCLLSDRQYHCERVKSDKCEESIITYQKANEDNYSFKNLIMHNYEEYSNPQVNYQSPQVSQSNLYKEENSKLYYYCENKQTFYPPTYIQNGTNLEEAYSREENFASVRTAQLIHSNQEIDFISSNILEENTNGNCVYTTNSQTERKECDSDILRENSVSNM
ncbi:Cryptochrome-1 [Eumeta japonica]|uniref:Cryptochrome-1 n=1 Tax=Eumeta variegata TaxID=151549 RepID=A0A4C1ZKM0_EUMVA|nr:Cryptochrome-1 [Eumeta japonica]